MESQLVGSNSSHAKGDSAFLIPPNLPMYVAYDEGIAMWQASKALKLWGDDIDHENRCRSTGNTHLYPGNNITSMQLFSIRFIPLKLVPKCECFWRSSMKCEEHNEYVAPFSFVRSCRSEACLEPTMLNGDTDYGDHNPTHTSTLSDHDYCIRGVYV